MERARRKLPETANGRRSNPPCRHFVQYHNVDQMGGPPTDPFCVWTNKETELDEGDRIWLVVGDGGCPKRFYLYSTFIVRQIESCLHRGFRTRIRGINGKVFDRSVPLNDEYWFDSLKERIGRGAFGLTRIQRVGLIGRLREIGEC